MRASSWIQQGRQALPPERKPPLTDPLPKSVRGPHAGGGVTRAQNGAGQNVARVMNTIVYTGKRHEHGDGQHEPNAAAIVDEEDHGSGEPIGRMGRRHTAAISPADAFRHVDIGEGKKWPRPVEDVFESIADNAVAKGDGHYHHESAKASACSSFPEGEDQGEDKDGRKKTVAAKKRHESIQKRIAQSRVNPMK